MITYLQVEAIMERAYIQVDDKLFQQKDDIATFSWSILRNWVLTRRYGSGIMTTHLWSGLIAQSG
jgi:hypothetical protein